MSLFPRIRMALAGGALVLAAGALVVPWYSSRALAAELQALAAEHGQGELRIRNRVHQAGWLTSQGTLDLEWRNQCAGDATLPTVVHLAYSAQHVPDLHRLTRLDWTASLAGAAAGSQLTGSGGLDYDGGLSSDMQLPALAMQAGGDSVQAAPSKGRLAWDRTALRLDWALERMALRSHGSALEARQISLRLDLKNRTLSSGRMALEVGSLQVVGQSLKDVVLEAEVQGVHTASVQTISKVLGARCGLQNATADEQQQLRAAVKKLLASGLSVGIPKLQGAGSEGGLEGRLLLSLAPAKGEEVALASQLVSSGQITIKGRLMPPDQRAFAMSTGYVTEVPDGVQAGFDYAAGTLTVSGKTLDGALVHMGLQKLDGWLTAFLEGRPLAPPDEELPVVAPAEAPAALPAS